MTNKSALRSFLFLLTLRLLVSGSGAAGVEDPNPTNPTVDGYYNATELQTTGTTRGQPAHSNGTSGEGTETNSTEHRSTGNESLASTETPLRTPFPVKNASSDLTTPSPVPTLSTSANVSSSVTTARLGTDGPSTSRATVKPVLPSTMEIRTTQHHSPTPTPVRSTRTTDPSTTKACPTAEPKRDGLVARCLIIISSLAAVAIIFIMTTIVLATKLAGNRYRHRARLLHETEMVCISALMNDSDHPIPTPKRPKSNGALIPITEDEDGDDLTLNSFLHDAEGAA